MNDREWFEAYWPEVYRLCRFMLKDASDAEDVSQEVFIKAMTSDRSKVDAMKPWLMRIAANECNSLLKRRNNGRRKERLLYFLTKPYAENPTEQAAERREDAEAFAELLFRLPDKLRMVIVLRYSADLSLQEISKTLNLPVGTVKSRLNRGIEMLRKLTKHEGRSKGEGEPWRESIKVN